MAQQIHDNGAVQVHTPESGPKSKGEACESGGLLAGGRMAAAAMSYRYGNWDYQVWKALEY